MRRLNQKARETRMEHQVLARWAVTPIEAYPSLRGHKPFLEQLESLWNSPETVARVRVLCPNLAEAVEKILREGSGAKERDKRRTLLSLVAFAIRACTRATPVSIAASVGMLKVQRKGLLPKCTGYKTVILDSVNDASEIQYFDEKQILFYPSPNLRVLDQAYRVVRGIESGDGGFISAELRKTAEAGAVLETAAGGATIRSLVAAVRTVGNGSSADYAERFVRRLVEAGFLVSTMSDITGRRTSCFHHSDLSEKAAGSTSRLLDLDDHNKITQLRDHNVSLFGGLSGSLSESALRSIEQAVLFLKTMAIQPLWIRGGDYYLREFIASHGSHAEVPFLLTLSKDLCLPAPSKHTDAVTDEWKQITGAQLEFRRTLIEQSRSTGEQFVSVDGRVGSPSPDSQLVYGPSADVLVSIIDGTVDPPKLSIRWIMQPGGCAAGRFCGENEEIRNFRENIIRHDCLSYGSFEHAQLENAFVHPIARRLAAYPSPRLRTVRTLGAVQCAEDISASSLMLGADDTGLYLRDADGERKLFVRRTNMIHPSYYSNLERSLLSISEGTWRDLNWNWGPMETTVGFLPGLLVSGVEISAPRWRVDEQERRTASYRDLRNRLYLRGVPQYISVRQTQDDRLLLDTSSDIHMELLCREIRRGAEWIEAANDPSGRGYVVSEQGHHVTEFVDTLHWGSITHDKSPDRRSANCFHLRTELTRFVKFSFPLEEARRIMLNPETERILSSNSLFISVDCNSTDGCVVLVPQLLHVVNHIAEILIGQLKAPLTMSIKDISSDFFGSRKALEVIHMVCHRLSSQGYIEISQSKSPPTRLPRSWIFHKNVKASAVVRTCELILNADFDQDTLVLLCNRLSSGSADSLNRKERDSFRDIALRMLAADDFGREFCSGLGAEIQCVLEEARARDDGHATLIRLVNSFLFAQGINANLLPDCHRMLSDILVDSWHLMTANVS